MKCTIASLLVGIVAIASCGSLGHDGITIMAASSLRVVSDELSSAYQNQTGVEVEFSLAGSQALAAQIRGGASADLFLAANMTSVIAAGSRVSEPQPFASNSLVILVPKGNPRLIEGLSDLARDDLVVVIADPTVPVGEYTQFALKSANVTLKPASLEPSVASVATRVATGNADAGIGYMTDARSNQALDAVPLGGGLVVNTEYFAATIDGSSDGEDFLAWLNGPGAVILRTAGFTQ